MGIEIVLEFKIDYEAVLPAGCVRWTDVEDNVKVRVVDMVVRIVRLYSLRCTCWENAVVGDGSDIHFTEFWNIEMQKVGKDCSMGEQFLEKGIRL